MITSNGHHQRSPASTKKEPKRTKSFSLKEKPQKDGWSQKMPTAIHHLASSQRTCMISASISSLSRHSPLESTFNFKIGSVSSVAEVEISLALLKCSWYAPEMLLVSEPFERDQPPFITHLSCLSPPPVHPDSLAERILHIGEHIIFHSLGYHLQEDIITEVYHHFAFKSSLHLQGKARSMKFGAFSRHMVATIMLPTECLLQSLNLKIWRRKVFMEILDSRLPHYQSLGVFPNYRTISLLPESLGRFSDRSRTGMRWIQMSQRWIWKWPIRRVAFKEPQRIPKSLEKHLSWNISLGTSLLKHLCWSIHLSLLINRIAVPWYLE